MVRVLESDVKEHGKVEVEVLVDKENATMTVQISENSFGSGIIGSMDDLYHRENSGNGQRKPLVANQDMEININDCLMTSSNGFKESICTDASESMSSFSNSLLETGHDSGELEVESQPVVDPNSDPFFDIHEFRSRKKLTEHWRRFIHPIMWRCKWLELQIRELQSQTKKYERVLAKHERQKQFHFERNGREQLNVKSLPFSSCSQFQNVLTRKKRIKSEETTDLASYMENHSLFSYFGHQKIDLNFGKYDSSHDRTANGNHDIWFEDANWVSLESHDGVTSEGEILKKIDASQTLVRRLMARVEQILIRLPKFSTVNIMTLPVPSAALSRLNTMPLSSPSNDTSSHGEATPLTDIFHSIAMEQGGTSYETAEEQILIHNEAAKEEMRDLRNFGSEPKMVASCDDCAPHKMDDNSPSGPLANQCGAVSSRKAKRVAGTRKRFGGRKKGSITKRSKKS